MRVSAWMTLTLLGLMISGFLSVNQTWQRIELWAFDRWTLWSAPGQSSLPITIVGIDEASFASLNQRWPWPRDWHAKVMQSLLDDGAAVVAFDVLFAEMANEAEDASFERAIAQAPKSIVLSADHAYRETDLLRQWVRVDPLLRFRQAGALAGLTSAELDTDTLIRRFPDGPDVFWRAVILAFQNSRPKEGVHAHVPEDAMIRHLGPRHSFPYISYAQILLKDPAIPKGYFQDQIVLIGRDVRASPEIGSAQSDLFSTPFIATSKLLVPGVEIHATLIENALTGLAIRPIDVFERLALSLSMVLLACLGLIGWRPWRSAVWFTGLAVGFLALSYRGFAQGGVWLPVSAGLAALGVMYVGMSLWAYFLEQKRSKQIKATFSKYVAPEVVNQMIAHPELLRLGGERREVTLLFCDLAGFTSMSEKLAPERVAKVINAYLTAMAKVIITHGGTVDKYIGDAVMAFWGAPIDDPEHAKHALAAAQAMQVAMDDLEPTLSEAGVGVLGLRIGLHSGYAVIGNMGSEDRFDYTALGDTVNLAARLEGVNKFYGTAILLSGDTAQLAGASNRLRLVDHVRVKGKEATVALYTPCDDPHLIEQSFIAYQSYSKGQWSQAKAKFESLIVALPCDPIAKVFLARLEVFERDPPLNWDGTVSLEKG